jgi:hypothetical protein
MFKSGTLFPVRSSNPSFPGLANESGFVRMSGAGITKNLNFGNRSVNAFATSE